MKAPIVLTVLVLHLFAGVGVTVVAYSCEMSGKVGVTVCLGQVPSSCFIDTCCRTEGRQGTSYSESGIACCDFTVQQGPWASQALFSGFRYGVDYGGVADRPPFHVLAARTYLTPLVQSDSVPPPAINLPLLI